MSVRALALRHEELEEPEVAEAEEETAAAEPAEEEPDELQEPEELAYTPPTKRNGRRKGTSSIETDNNGSPNATTLFFRELSRNSKLLTPTEELAFGMVIIEAREKIEELKAELDILKAKKRKSRNLSLKENLAYQIEAIEGEIVDVEEDPKLKRAFKAMQDGNILLVISIAKRYAGRFRGEPLMDLVQEGFFGLNEGIWRFDPRMGNRFSTYGTWWIRHAIVRALADKGRIIRIPVHLIDFLYRMTEVIRKLGQELERPPNDAEIAQGLQEYAEAAAKKSYEKKLFKYEARGGVKPEPPPKITKKERKEAIARLTKKVEKVRALHAIAFPVSLDSEINRYGGDGEGEGTFQAIMPDRQPHSRPDTAMHVEDSRASVVDALLAVLKPIEREIIRLRYLCVDEDPANLDDDGTLSLKEVGKRFDLTRERIRQLQKIALAKLRSALERGRIKCRGSTLTVQDLQIFRRAEAE